MEGRHLERLVRGNDDAAEKGGKEGIRHIYRRRGAGSKVEGFIAEDGSHRGGPYHKIHGRPDAYKDVERKTMNPNK